MYLTHGLSHCDAENRETGGCRVAESGVPFLNIDARYSYCFVARANERARWFFAGRRLNIYDSGRKTSAAQISEAEAETGDKRG